MTKAEKAYHAAVRENGCITCHLFHGFRCDAEIHHRLSGGRKMGEMFVLGLCPSCHRGGLGGKKSHINPLGIMSRDHSQRRFEKHYGMTEAEMQAQQDKMIEANKAMTA